MQTKTIQNYVQRVNKQIAKAMERLRKLGAREITERGVRTLYIPGNVNMCASFSPDSYGEFVASRKRTHKHYLRANHLGKFRKGRS